MKDERRIAYSEVDAILDLLDREYTERVPVKIREFIKENKDTEYISNIDPNNSLADQDLRKETVSFLTLLQLNYWCENEEEKQEILRELVNTDKIREEELREKYNPDNIFKDRNNNQSQTVAIVEYKEPSLIRKILDRIIRMFKKNY